MSRYVAITESEMSDFMSALGFTELSVDQRGSFGRRPVKERVYETPVGDGKIRVYSSVTGAVSRDRGKDAIRVQYWLGDQKVYGAKRVHRTQNWRKNLLQRTEEIRESADSGPLSRIPKDSRGDLMTARRGRLAHERFWGSVNYPELRESRRFEAVSVLPRGLKTDKITDRVMAIQYMMDDSEKQQKLLKLQTALKMGLITEDEILEKLDRAMSKNAESNVARKTEKEELILEQLNNNRQNSKYDGKFENTEGGICELLGITRSGVSKTLRDMESKGLIYSRNLHVPGGRRKVQCWFVVGSGTDRGFGAESYKPPASAISAAKRGLEQRKKYGRGGLSPAEAKSQGIDSGVTRARKIASGKVSKHDVRRMSAFNRHRKNNNPSKKMPDGGPTAGTIAWNLWGGTSGVNWAKKKSAAMNAEDFDAESWSPKKSMKQWMQHEEQTEEEVTWDYFHANLYPPNKLLTKIWTFEGKPNGSVEAWWNTITNQDDDEQQEQLEEVFERHYSIILKSARKDVQQLIEEHNWYDMMSAESSDSYDNLAHQDEMAQEAYEEYVEELDPETDYPPMSFEEWYEQTMAIYDTPEYDQYLEQQYLQIQEDAEELARLEALEAEEKLSKTSCCCGADESNPCVCMKAPEPMSCRAKEPKCACYKALEKNAEDSSLDYNSFSNDMEALLAKYSQLLLSYETEYQDGIMEVFMRFKPYNAYFDVVDLDAESEDYGVEPRWM